MNRLPSLFLAIGLILLAGKTGVSSQAAGIALSQSANNAYSSGGGTSSQGVGFATAPAPGSCVLIWLTSWDDFGVVTSPGFRTVIDDHVPRIATA